MKKIVLIISFILLSTTILSCSAQVCKNTIIIAEEWTGNIRIEGKDETVFKGIVKLSDSNISARNVDTGETETHYISYPSVLGAVDEASKIDGFSYSVDYWPAWNAFIIVTIKDDSDWWHYWVDYNLPMVDVGTYNLTNQDNGILVGYLESWEAHALKTTVDKYELYVNEELTATVTNETDKSVEEATVFVDSKSYTTNNEGEVTITISEKGNYKIYSEKDGFVRSDKVEIMVKNSRNIRYFHYFIQNLKELFLLRLLSI
jgi:hypothetical protein